MREKHPESGPIGRPRAPWAARALAPREGRSAGARRGLPAGLVGLLLCLAVLPGAPRAGTREEMQSLDEQVQEIKSDVLGIAAELTRLEEKLLYPSDTQVSVFVALEGHEGFRLDSVRIRIDGELVAHHVYSFKELEALRKGGVQRIHTGNLRTGEHQLEVSVAGKLAGGEDVTGTETFGFHKEAGPRLVGVRVAGQAGGGARIELGGWAP